MPPVKIPDDIFDIDMSLVDFTKPDFGDMNVPIPIPQVPDFDKDITVFSFDPDDFVL